jgi:hypothetical protein
MHHGALHVLAIFDKPDPLDGPFFEETIYITPSSATDEVQRAIVDGATRAAAALGLRHGPIHAECRVSPSTDSGCAPSTLREPQGRPEQGREATGSGRAEVFALEVAARPIGACVHEHSVSTVSNQPITIRNPQSHWRSSCSAMRSANPRPISAKRSPPA